MPHRTGQAVSVAQAQAVMAKDTTLVIDVRTPGEYETAHIPHSINIPVAQVDAHLRRIVQAAGGTMVLVCQSGGRAVQAADSLERGGFSDVLVLDGGMNAWLAAGAESESGETQRWALERQVRLVAGALVASSILASTKWPKARFLAGAIGGGLTFAAVSNTCAMGAVLSKLPYNQGPGCDIDVAIAKMQGS